MSTFRNPQLDYKGRVRIRIRDSCSNIRIPDALMRTRKNLSQPRFRPKKIQKSKKSKKLFFIRPASLKKKWRWKWWQDFMRLASLRSLNTRLRSYLHTHTHTGKPCTPHPLWARVYFPTELRDSIPQGTRDAQFPTTTEYHWYSPFIGITSTLWHAKLVPNYGVITSSTLYF